MTAPHYREPPDEHPRTTVHARVYGDALAGCHAAPDERHVLAELRTASLPSTVVWRERRRDKAALLAEVRAAMHSAA